jgi:hypothetical protein
VSRYEIREHDTSALAREMGFGETIFLVWDTEENKRVPFGRYADRAAAQRRIQRLEERACESS